MGKARRISLLVGAAFTILLALILLFLPDKGYLIVALILAGVLMVRGIQRVVYYFRMARNMVGGHGLLYSGILMFDVGIFVFSLADIPVVYVMFYLIGMHAANGAIAVLRALEQKKIDDPSWRLQLIGGVINLVIALVCLIFIRSGRVAIYIYSIGLIVSAIGRVVTAFRKTAVIYIA